MMHKHPPRLITQTCFENNKIVSYGLIVYAINDKKCIIVQRKHSVEFLFLLLGQYRGSILPFLISSITEDEHQLIQQLLNKSISFSDVFQLVGLEEKDVAYGTLRFLEHTEDIKRLISKTAHFRALKWTWPKGRYSIEDGENEFKTALREFKEEVEIDLPSPLLISDRMVVETIKSLSCKTIETHCWLYMIRDIIPLPAVVDHKEVKDRQWMDIREASILLEQPHLLTQLAAYL